jgi:integrase
MGRQNIRGGELHIRQQKTGVALRIPIHPRLQEALDLVPAGQMTFLITRWGRPFTPGPFTNWFQEKCRKAGLRGLSVHGLRKAASRRLAEAGCSTHEIASLTGHVTLKMIAHYTASVDQGRLARQAVEALVQRSRPDDPDIPKPTVNRKV